MSLPRQASIAGDPIVAGRPDFQDSFWRAGAATTIPIAQVRVRLVSSPFMSFR
jgi:hypothetical protein